MISETQLNHRFFVLGVLAAAVIPRQPSDDKVRWWSIGGRLSHNFRKLLLVIVAFNLCRLFLSSDDPQTSTYQLGSDVLGILEVTSLTLLCFNTPYVLQKGLSQFRNIVPGQNLKRPLYLAAILSFLGVVLSRTVHPNFWALKKLANAVSGPPIISTLGWYNSFTTSQTHGRGFVFAQTVIVIEYWHLILQLLCATAYALDSGMIGTDAETLLDRTMKAARSIAFAADWTRVLVHAMFMNQLDELYHTSDFRDDANGEGNSPSSGESNQELVRLRSKS